MPKFNTVLRKAGARKPYSGRSVNGGVVESASYPDDDFLTPSHDNIPNLALDYDIISVQSGNWTSGSTWDLNRAPEAGEVVAIQRTHTVTYNLDATTRFKAVGIAGTLSFVTNSDTQLWVQHLFVYGPDTLGTGKYGELRIGTEGTPVEAATTAEVVFLDETLETGTVESPGPDPAMYGNGLVMMGKIRVCGATKTPFLRLASEADDTDTTIELESAPTGWRSGDLLYLPDSRQATDADRIANGDNRNWEYPTISSVASSTVSISSGLSHDHPGAYDRDAVLDYLPHLANLTRNVVFRSEDANGVRGHTIFTGRRCDADVRFAAFLDMGRTINDEQLHNTTFSGSTPTLIGTNQIGRYSVHIHHVIGPEGLASETPQWYMEGCVISDSSTDYNFRWALAIHDSHYGMVKDCIAHRYQGWGFGFEEGNERGNVLDGCMSARIRGGARSTTRVDSGSGLTSTSERGTHGRGFYISSPLNSIRNCVAVNIGDWDDYSSGEYGYGYVFFSHFTQDIDSTCSVPTAKGSATFETIDIRYRPIAQFFNNEVYGSSRGMEYWMIQSGPSGEDYTTGGFGTTTIEDLKIWHVDLLNTFGYMTSGLTIDGLVIRGDQSKVVGLWPTAHLTGDYATRYITLRNWDIQGTTTGFDLSSQMYGTTCVMEDCHFCCVTAITIQKTYASGGGSEQLGEGRYFSITNCTFVAPAGESLVAINAFLPDPATVTSSIINWVSPIEIEVYDYQGVPGDDFRVWFDEQDENEITPQSVVHPSFPLFDELWTGSPDAGQTNAQNWSEHGVAIAGSVRPSVGLESRTGVVQQVTDL